MEGIKDAAARAKTSAERKIEQKDYVGARKLALSAQSLYPGLDGLSQLLEVIDVYVAAQEKINEEEDWYHVLGVSPTADDGALKKRYFQLSLMLHPDKNHSFGAEGAFKLICAAYKLLADKEEREIQQTEKGKKQTEERCKRDEVNPEVQEYKGKGSHDSKTCYLQDYLPCLLLSIRICYEILRMFSCL